MRFATTMKRSDSCSPIGFPLALWALLSLTFRRRQTSQIRCYYLTCARCALEPRWVFPYLALSIGRCCLLPGGRHRLPHIRNEAVSLHAFALRLRTLHCLRLNLTSRLRLQGYVLTARYGFVRRRLSLLCNNNAYWRTPLREAIAARGLLEEAAIESTAQALEAQFGRCCFDLQASVPLCAPAPVRRFLEAPHDGLPPSEPLPSHWIKRLFRLPADALATSLEEQLLPLAFLTSPAPETVPGVVLLQSGLLTLRRRLRNTFLVGCANDSARKQLAQLPKELRQKESLD